MNKDVLVSIKGIQISDDNSRDSLEIVTVAEYYEHGSKHYIMYEDMDEENNEKTKNLIKISESSVEMQKRGLVSTNMVFEKNKSHRTFYTTSYGEFSVEIKTSDIDMEMSDGQMQIQINYSLSINEQQIAENTVRIEVRER